MRYFDTKTIELLAPAGNFAIFESVLQTNCDAIYFGGQTLNMRMIRKGFNFLDEELDLAVKLAHEHSKKAYITVNNLVGFEEVDAARQFLKTLAQIKPDAIIIQDFAILELIRELELTLPIHASVMMNVHNVPMVKALKNHGITRVVLSREASLEDVRWIRAQTGMEIEYFTHGDMCIAHGGQCYYSSMLFGMSSNRGKCLKPCRWWFSKTESGEEKSFPMAVKDLSLYRYLPEMIHAGVTSFKIEGRMREKEFITTLINHYADALDRFIEDPVGYDRSKNYNEIYESRKRDLSTAYAFGKPGIQNINTRFEGTGKFYSTGKMFSTPTSEKNIDQEQTDYIREQFKSDVIRPRSAQDGVRLSVRVNSFLQAMAAIEAGIDRLYLAADVYKSDNPMTLKEVIKLKEFIDSRRQQKTELYIATPRMMNDLHFELYRDWLKKLKPHIDGILVGNLGAIFAFKSLGLDMAGDYSLNIFNGLSAEFYLKEGLTQITPSLEIGAEGFRRLCENCGSLEVVSYGRLTAMYFDHDFHKAFNAKEAGPLKLYNEAGIYEIYKDQHGRSHMLTTHRFTLLPFLDEIVALGVKMLRIEGQTETPESITEIIARFKAVLAGSLTSDEILPALEWTQYTYGALPFKIGE